MRSLLPIMLLSFLFSTCKKVDLDSIHNLNGNQIMIIGHGGDGFQTGRNPVPTDSESSIAKAIEYQNADGCEVDVQLSSDSVLILFHDEFMEQTTNCQGCVTEKTSQELFNCRFQQDFAVNALQNETLISLERIFQKYFPSVYNPQLFIDIKLSDNCGQNSEEYYNRLAKGLTFLIGTYHTENNIFISCGKSELLDKIQSLNPNLKLVFNIGAGEFESGMETAITNGYYGLEIYNDYISKDQISEAHSNNLWVVIYGVKSRNTQIEAVQKSPDVIITDDVPLLQQILTNQ